MQAEDTMLSKPQFYQNLLGLQFDYCFLQLLPLTAVHFSVLALVQSTSALCSAQELNATSQSVLTEQRINVIMPMMLESPVVLVCGITCVYVNEFIKQLILTC